MGVRGIVQPDGKEEPPAQSLPSNFVATGLFQEEGQFLLNIKHMLFMVYSKYLGLFYFIFDLRR